MASIPCASDPAPVLSELFVWAARDPERHRVSVTLVANQGGTDQSAKTEPGFPSTLSLGTGTLAYGASDTIVNGVPSSATLSGQATVRFSNIPRTPASTPPGPPFGEVTGRMPITIERTVSPSGFAFEVKLIAPGPDSTEIRLRALRAEEEFLLGIGIGTEYALNLRKATAS